MLNHHSRHNGFCSKLGTGFFGFGGTSGKSCDILNTMVNTALRLNNEAQIQILFTNINPGDTVVIAGLKTGKPVYIRLFANKLKSYKLFNIAADTRVNIRTRAPPLFISVHLFNI